MNRCPYPGCTAKDLHDGDHQIGRPARPLGKIRCTQEFMVNGVLTPPCDLYNIPKLPKAIDAIGFYLDELGFGWSLCYPCVKEFGAVEEMAGKVNDEEKPKSRKATRAPAPRRSQAAPPQSSVRSAKVIAFERRAR